MVPTSVCSLCPICKGGSSDIGRRVQRICCKGNFGQPHWRWQVRTLSAHAGTWVGGWIEEGRAFRDTSTQSRHLDVPVRSLAPLAFPPSDIVAAWNKIRATSTSSKMASVASRAALCDPAKIPPRGPEACHGVGMGPVPIDFCAWNHQGEDSIATFCGCRISYRAKGQEGA